MLDDKKRQMVIDFSYSTKVKVRKIYEIATNANTNTTSRLLTILEC